MSNSFSKYCVCWMLLIFILVKFSKIFCCLRLCVTPGYWAIDQLFFSIGAIVVSPARAKVNQDNVEFYFIKMTIEHFIYSYWKLSVVWETVSLEYGRFTSYNHKEVGCFLSLLLQFNTSEWFACSVFIRHILSHVLISSDKTIRVGFGWG